MAERMSRPAQRMLLSLVLLFMGLLAGVAIGVEVTTQMIEDRVRAGRVFEYGEPGMSMAREFQNRCLDNMGIPSVSEGPTGVQIICRSK